MRAISVREPAASAIAHGEKKMEHRSRRIAPGPLLVVAGGAALCVVDVKRVSGEPGAYAWHLERPRLVAPFAVRTYGWIVRVDAESIRFLDNPRATARCTRPNGWRSTWIGSRSQGPYTFEIDDRQVRGAHARTAAAARRLAGELAREHGRDVWILRDGFTVSSVSPTA